MKVLVSAASKHGATAEITRAIADTLESAGFAVSVIPPDAVTTVADFDAVVLGSGVYLGHWLDAAKDLVERHCTELAARPVWLFSSGPIGDPPKPEDDPVDVADIVEALGPRGHRIFAGLLDTGRLGLGEKVILKAVRAPAGDYRPWEEIHAWAREIADALAPR